MAFLKFAGGAIAAIILVKIALWLLSLVFGVVWFAVGLLKLALIVAVIYVICYGVYRVLNHEQKSEA